MNDPELAIEHLDFDPEGTAEALTAVEVAVMFGEMAKTIKEALPNQEFGVRVFTPDGYPDNTYLTIKESPKHGRVTHVELFDPQIGDNQWAITHEVHFRSRDPKNGDFSVSHATLIKYEYNRLGEIEAKYVRNVDQVELDDHEVVDFLSDIQDEFARLIDPYVVDGQ